MSELNLYLTTLSRQLLLEENLTQQIEVSLAYLRSRIWSVFQNKLEDVLIFGSYDRGTSISMDPNMDVDVLIVFKRRDFKPDTYLYWINEFSKKYYSGSIVYRDRPTITITLKHIKFELVPAYRNAENVVEIPAKKDDSTLWISTYPEVFKSSVLAKDVNNGGLILPCIRLFKYWNIFNGKIFSSHAIEKCIVDKRYYFILTQPTLEGYFFDILDDLYSITLSKKQKEALNTLKQKIDYLSNIRKGLTNDFIKSELSSILPPIHT